MVQCRPRALALVLAIGMSLWTPDCLAQEEASTTEGTCNANDPGSCQVGAEFNIETDGNVVNNAKENDCQDDHIKCFDWSQIGECDHNPNYMLRNCRRSCLQCPDQRDELAKLIEEEKKKRRVWTQAELEVAADMGVEQNLENDGFNVSVEEASARIVAARENIQSGEFDDNLLEICKNAHEDCTTW